MDLDRLALFAAAYRLGGFAAAAETRNLSPSTVSRAIASLETDLQTRLFQRSTRRFSPTEAGVRLFERIAPLLADFDVLRNELADLNTRPSGPLRVTASVSFGQAVIAPMLAGFIDTYPEIELDLALSDARTNLLDNQIDLAVRHGALDDSQLTARRLIDVSYYLVASPNYVSARGAPPAPNALGDHLCLAMPFERYRRRWRFRRDGEDYVHHLSPAMTLSNPAALHLATRHGAGIALLPDWLINSDLRSGDLVQLLPGWRAFGDDDAPAIWLVRPNRTYVPAKVRAFEDCLTAELGART